MKTTLFCLLALVFVSEAAPDSCASYTANDCGDGQVVNLLGATAPDDCCVALAPCTDFAPICDTIPGSEVDATGFCGGTVCGQTEGDRERCCLTLQPSAAPTQPEGEDENGLTDSEAQTSLVVTLVIYAIMWVLGLCFFGYYCSKPPTRMYTDKQQAEAKDKKKKHATEDPEEESSS